MHGKPRHSVRGIIVHRGYLYVADEAGDAVKVFALASGRLVARIRGKQLTKPVHLLLHGTRFLSARPARAAFWPMTFLLGPMGKADGPSGYRSQAQSAFRLAIGPDGDLYVAERFGQRVLRFSMDGKKKGTFIDRPTGYSGVSGSRAGPAERRV